ncbi:MAG: hypothetical protein KKB59_00435 [Spirochaetes bacterium]|nr:hypothetical protein [Spirochaetota bacterium]
MSVAKKIADSVLAQVVLTIPIYSLYALLAGLSTLPSVLLVAWGVRALASADRWIAFSIVLGFSLFLFFQTAVLVMGLSIRLLSLGVKPGRYPEKSATVIRWLLFSGIYTMMTQLVLPVVPMSFMTNLFFRLVGCRMGRNVKLNSYMLNDAYLLTLGDGVVVGGQTDISCHIYENGHLVLQPVSIGAGSVIGAHCYISPGVTIGERCLVGLGCYIRQGASLPDGSRLTSIGGVPLSIAQRIEKGRF